MTLIEAVAGLVVLGTLLVSISVARGRFVRQRAQAEQKIAAAAALDRLVARWMVGNGSGIPVDAQGSLEGTTCLWRTRAMEDRAARELGARVIRVEVVDRKSVNRPILVLDLMRHDERRATATGGRR